MQPYATHVAFQTSSSAHVVWRQDSQNDMIHPQNTGLYYCDPKVQCFESQPCQNTVEAQIAHVIVNTRPGTRCCQCLDYANQRLKPQATIIRIFLEMSASQAVLLYTIDLKLISLRETLYTQLVHAAVFPSPSSLHAILFSLFSSNLRHPHPLSSAQVSISSKTTSLLMQHDCVTWSCFVQYPLTHSLTHSASRIRVRTLNLLFSLSRRLVSFLIST
jgi:hypothetical protein